MKFLPSKRKKIIEAYSDTELLHKFRETEDGKLLAVLYQRYAHLLMGVGLKYLQNEDDAKDALMEVYERLADKVLKFEIRDFSSWIYQVMRNHCLMHLRKQKNKDKAEKIWDDDMENETFMHPMDNDTKVDLTEQLLHIIETLPIEQQTCIRYFYLEQKSYQEIAQLTGFAVKQVKSYLQNGKRNLQIKMKSKSG